ncbi:MAG: aminopeptidase P family N-terminal domain-containing protein, partial [Pseudomonadota bacterium]
MSVTPIFAPPSIEEIETRRDRVRAEMVRQGLDYYVAVNPDNVYYLTNFANFVHERPFILVMGQSESPIFVVPKLEVPHVQSRIVGPLEIAPYREFPAPPGERWI